MTQGSAPAADLTVDSAQNEVGQWRAAEIAAVAVIALGGLLASMTESVIVPVLPAITADLHSSAANAQWLVTATLLAAALVVPAAGRLGDLYGKKRILLMSAGALTAGSLITVLSHNLALMIAGRAVVGLSIAAVPLGLSLLPAVLPRKRVAFGIAAVTAMLGFGGALAIPFASWVAGHADYTILFWIGVVGGALALAGVWLLLPEPPGRAAGRLDLLGTVVLSAALVCLLLPLSETSRWGWASVTTIGLLVGSVVLLVGLVAWERRSPSPLIDVVVNARPGLLLTNLASVCVGFALFATLIGTLYYVEAPTATGYGFGSSSAVAGLCLLPSGLAMLAFSPLSAAITNRYGPKIALAAGALIIAVGFLARIGLDGHLWEVVAGTAVAGAGTGMAYAAMPSLVLRAAPRSGLAAANGLNAVCRSVGSSLASAVGGSLLFSSLVFVAGHAFPSRTAYVILFAICAGAAVLGAVVALAVPANPDAGEPISRATPA